MNSKEKNIFILFIGGIPGIGKSYFANKISVELKDIYEIKYLNFDLLENINKDNYLQYQQMRNDYLLKIQEILKNINVIDIKNKSLLIILDDNFFLKSMRKKIYNAILDKIIQIQNNITIENKTEKLYFYYLEILLKPKDINYCIKMNSLRNINQRIPDNIILNMNNMFEYNSPYANKNQTFILDINNEENLNNPNLIIDILYSKEKYIIKQKEKEIKEKVIIEKDNKIKLIDDIEDIIRKEINAFLKNNDTCRKKGKEISLHKKEYMKIIINYIKNIEQNEKDAKFEINSQLFLLLKNLVNNNISNISQNENYSKIIKEDFSNFLRKKI